jgi:hypothetical protein
MTDPQKRLMGTGSENLEWWQLGEEAKEPAVCQIDGVCGTIKK